MTPGSRLRPSVFLLIGLALFSLGHADSSAPGNGPDASAPAPDPAAVAQARENLNLRDAYQLASQGKLDESLTLVSSILQADPKNLMALSLRGQINTQKKLWDPAIKDYQAMLQIDSKNSAAMFNLEEIKFRQKNYDGAKPGFLAMEKGPDLGDLATYKVFLCDLFGGHEDAASKELDAFNQVGGNASYYFANAAWFLYHHKTPDALDWLNRASRIYSVTKFSLYTSSLRDLGYLSVPPAPAPAPAQK